MDFKTYLSQLKQNCFADHSIAKKPGLRKVRVGSNAKPRNCAGRRYVGLDPNPGRVARFDDLTLSRIDGPIRKAEARSDSLAGMVSAVLALAVLAAPQTDAFDPGPNPLLMRHPTVSKTAIVFQFAGDLWRAPRAGGEAVRLTSAPGTNSDPFFSPDGSLIAFTGNYDGNTDVYVIPANGGVPKRLTAHPSPDHAVGWTPDGKSVLFSSRMLSNTDHPRLFTVSKHGGLPKPLPLP